MPKKSIQSASSGAAPEEAHATGFPGGMPVYTKAGLRPIEEINVGDWVLSKHESGEGEREYKRVTKTFVHEDRQLIVIRVRSIDEDGVKRVFDIPTTPGHPFGVLGKGWLEAGTLKDMGLYKSMKLEVVADEISEVIFSKRLFRTDKAEFAWAPHYKVSDGGAHLDLRTFKFVQENRLLKYESVRKTGRVKPEHLYNATVYNIEVEDFHTFYIGEPGIWVHNKTALAQTNLLPC